MYGEQVNSIAAEIARAIDRQQFSGQLPPRHVLKQRYGGSVSAWTKVYDLLERQGKVTRVHGRGVFIAEVPPNTKEKAYDALVARLQSGLFAVGNIMPPAPVLAAEYGLTEKGIYSAYELLVAEGYLVTHGNQVHIVSSAPRNVELTPSVQKALNYMADKIKSGWWAPDSLIPFMKSVQSWTGCSRESLTCAAELLIRKGVLLPTPNCRYRVVRLERWPADL